MYNFEDIRRIVTNNNKQLSFEVLRNEQLVLFDIKPEIISDIYLQAWKAKLKGVTIYRDGSRFPILSTNENELTDFQKNNFNVTLFGKDIIHKSIYKKMRVKYDFYYVLLNDFEATTAKIGFLKNKGISFSATSNFGRGFYFCLK